MFMTFVDLLASCDHRLKLKTVHVLSALAFDIRSITGCSCLFFRPRVTIRVQVSFLRPGQGGACIFINLNTIYFWWVSCISDISKTRPYPGTQSHFRYRICPILLFLFFTSYLNWIYFLSHSFIYFTFTFNKNSLHKYPSSIAISFLVPGVRNLRLEILESKLEEKYLVLFYRKLCIYTAIYLKNFVNFQIIFVFVFLSFSFCYFYTAFTQSF